VCYKIASNNLITTLSLRWRACRINVDIMSINRVKALKLENVAIANALQLEAARRRAVPLHFNFVACVKFELALPIRCRFRAFLLLIRHVRQ